jgi:hypothetical protein
MNVEFWSNDSLLGSFCMLELEPLHGGVMNSRQYMRGRGRGGDGHRLLALRW